MACDMDMLGSLFDPKASRLFKGASHPGLAILGRSTSMGAVSHTSRSCVQCGATKTPQWREGPAGPKTLCNACGVKRCRQMRLLVEGKRASAAAAHRASGGLRKANSDSRSDDGSEELPLCTRDSLPAACRPKRKAAARSASRTATLANTGDWPDDEGDDQLCTTPTSSARILAGEDHTCNSDSAEEVTWTPRPRGSNVPPFSPMVASVGLECAAAVNLLSMSIKESELDLSLQAVEPSLRAQSAALQVMAPKQAAQRVAAVLKPPPQTSLLPERAFSMPNPLPQKQDASSYIKQQSEKLTTAMTKVAEQHHPSMQAAREELEEHARQVASADAAVAAVARILAVKQALATRARLMAKVAAKQMQHHLIATTGQDPWERHSKRARQ